MAITMTRLFLSAALILTNACLGIQARGYLSPYFLRTNVRECTAGFGAPNEVVGFDGSVSSMDSANKYLISTYKPTEDDICKYQVRIDTAADISGQVYVDWMGVAFGVHASNAAKFERNYRVSLTQGVVEIRGRGYKPPQTLTLTMDEQCYETASDWYFCIKKLSDGHYLITAGRVDGSCWIEVTYWEDAATNDKVVVRISDFYWDQVEGQCGNLDGDSSNDDMFCMNTDPGTPQACVDGEHQNN